MECKICHYECRLLGEIAFNKGHEKEDNIKIPEDGKYIPYYNCTFCGFIFTTYFDQWSDDQFKRYIYNDAFFSQDMNRSTKAEIPSKPTDSSSSSAASSSSYMDGLKLQHLIQQFQSGGLLKKEKTELNVLDFGSAGNPGDTAKAFIDNGYKITCYDPYTSGVKYEPLTGLFDVIYLVEVIEHCFDLDATLKLISGHLHDDGIILLTTNLQPYPAPADVINHWYITPRTGHVSIFTFKSLFVLFRKYQINLINNPTVLFGKKIKNR